MSEKEFFALSSIKLGNFEPQVIKQTLILMHSQMSPQLPLHASLFNDSWIPNDPFNDVKLRDFPPQQ